MALALMEEGADVNVLFMKARYLDEKQDASSCWTRLRPYSLPLGSGSGQQRLLAALAILRYRISIWPRWVHQVVRTALQLHSAAKFDLVYSRSLPMFGHVAGYWTARRLELPWVANINDPWDEHLFPGVQQKQVSKLYATLSMRWLRCTLANAEAVTFPSFRLGRFTSGLASSQRGFEVVPHVGDRSDAPSPGSREFRLLHAGKLGSNEITGRSTETLLAALRHLVDAEPEAAGTIRLVLVGPEDPKTTALIQRLGLAAHVENVGAVSYEESLAYIAKASACVLIEANMPEGVYLPSKLADYLVAGKPVLALSPNNGTVADLAAEGGIHQVAPADAKAAAAALVKIYQAHNSGRLGEVSPPPALARSFSREAVGRKFLDLAESIVADKKGATDLAAESGVPVGAWKRAGV
jgi:glycosyltransferase involved in cell wall biosynthesis